MGREARLRQVAKAAAPLTYKLHVTDREAWALSLHLLNSRQKDHGEQLRLSRAVEELGLQPTLDLLYTPQGAGLSVAQFDANQFDIVEISRDTLDFILERTNSEMASLHALCLTGLVTRLKDLKDGRYQLPVQPSKAPETDATTE